MSNKKRFGDILVEAGIITATTLERALERQKSGKKRLGTVLEEMGVITEKELIETIAKQYGFRTVVNFAIHPFFWDVLGLIPEDMAIQKLIFPLKQVNGMLAIATTDPFDSATLDYLAKKTGLKIIPVLSTKKDITEAIGRHYLGGRESPRDKAKILVVEDSLAVAIIIQSALIKEGYEAVIAHDGLEGMKMAFSERPDLIICDMVMPRLDGYAMKNAVHGNPATASIPIILLTSKASSEDEQRALSAGFFDFISKPVQPLRVISRVKRALELIQDLRR